MPNNKFYEMVKMVLPDDMTPYEFEQYATDDLWKKNSENACLCALKNCQRINWEAYLERYGDVKRAGIDAFEHFVKNGVFERRKLISWHPLKKFDKQDDILISVLIASYNNDIYLIKAIESVIRQTLENIEIIIVDDASSDESIKIIKKYASLDKRIKYILSNENSGTYMTRKKGVMAATGRYIMFLDCDDYLAPNACEIAYNEIKKGFDIVKFGAHVVNNCKAEDKVISNSVQYLNGGRNREYSGKEQVREMYATRKLPWNLWVRIYLRELCVNAYNEIGDGYFLSTEDMLANIAITRIARSQYVIADKLYFYNMGSGISTDGEKSTKNKYLINLLETTMTVINYAKKYEMDVDYDLLYNICCNWAINMWIRVVPDDELDSCLRKIIEIIGLDKLLLTLIENHGKDISKIADKIKYSKKYMNKKIKNIGIYCPTLRFGGIEIVVRNMCHILMDNNYKVTIFKIKDAHDEISINEGVKIVYITQSGSGSKRHLDHCMSVYEEIKNNSIDLMIYTDTYHPGILWDIIVLHYSDVPVILNHHGNYVMSFMRRFGISYGDRDAVFACADVVTCLSAEDELFFRSIGINAWHIHNPVCQIPYETRTEVPQAIAVMARMEEPNKQVGQSLKVIREVIQVAPWVKAYFIGDFENEKVRQEFFAKAKEMGIYRNIILTGWTEKTNNYLKKCGVLLSTSYWESFAMNIAEAQALGLPCVVYDLPIEQINNNESIIVVKQGEFGKAAEEICDLLADSERWHKLSRIATEKVRKYDTKNFRNKIVEMIDKFQFISKLNEYPLNVYENVIRYSTFYINKTNPVRWY